MSQSRPAYQRLLARTVTSRIQLSGWNFMLHRLIHGLVRWDTRMLHDPLRSSSRAMTVGIILSGLVTVGAFVLSLFSSQPALGNEKIVAIKQNGALFVRIGQRIHPVHNLTSAQLITGSPELPKFVNASAITNIPRGPLVGIPGAPNFIPKKMSTDASNWSICDSAHRAKRNAPPAVTAIIGRPTAKPDTFPLAPSSAIVVRMADEINIIYGNHRTPVDINNPDVMRALSGQVNAINLPQPTPISAALYNAIPSTPFLGVPFIADLGTPPTWPSSLPDQALIGSVLQVTGFDGNPDLFVVLKDGIQRVTHITAQIVINGYPQSSAVIPVPLGALSGIPRSSALDVDYYPDQPLRFVDTFRFPVTCLTWSQEAGTHHVRSAIFIGGGLPLSDDQLKDVVQPSLVSSQSEDGIAPNGVYVHPGTGLFVQVRGGSPTAHTAESAWWISDTGVKYSIPSRSGRQDKSPQKSLGISGPPLPMPWSILKLLPSGPELSRENALLLSVTHTPN
ncbi:type VII secretion protein EccB [Mycobacterium sp.]|uniref:type VII secretion protein EccB n=1 Tax=Mycobacterium sp. TaxID=1785 RepID=UPI003BA91CC7